MNKTNFDINDFISKAKNCLAINFADSFNEHNISIKDVYPYIFKEHNIFDENIEGKDLQDYIGKLYESLIPTNIKKDLGQFYTRDNNVINTMLSKLDLLDGKILEPSCGSGNFLVKIVLHIIESLKLKGYTAEEILNYICDNIYGNDKDLIAIEITEINILTVLVPLMAEAKKKDKDFIMKRIHLTNYSFEQKDVFKAEFSVVIGNPPYVTMYGKRSRNMTEEKRAYFNTFDFVQNKKGNNKFNMSMFFIENGLKALKENGKLVYILDISFFETAYVDMRKYIVENYYINSLTVGLQEFENVASGQIILDVSNTREYNKEIKIIDYATLTENKISQVLWDDKKNKYKYFSPLNNMEQTIIEKISKCKRLDYYYPGKALRTCCALTGKTDEFIVNPREEHTHVIFPYIEGSKGLKGKFNKPTPQRYIKYDYDLQLKLSDEFKDELEKLGVKNKKRVTLGDKDAYLSPKIFIRQSANEIIATYCDEPYAANNSIYILTNKTNNNESNEMLMYTCGLLNSDLITFYCRVKKIIRSEKGKTPQIKTSDLKDIRIKKADQYYNSVIIIVKQLLDNPTQKHLLEELNRIVYQIYNLEEKEIQYIKDYLSQ